MKPRQRFHTPQNADTTDEPASSTSVILIRPTDTRTNNSSDANRLSTVRRPCANVSTIVIAQFGCLDSWQYLLQSPHVPFRHRPTADQSLPSLLSFRRFVYVGSLCLKDTSMDGKRADIVGRTDYRCCTTDIHNKTTGLAVVSRRRGGQPKAS